MGQSGTDSADIQVFPHHSSLIHGRDDELHVLRLHWCVMLTPWFVCICVCIYGVVVNIYMVKITYLFLLMYIMVILQVLVISEYCSSFCASAAPVHEQFQIVNYDSIIQTHKRFKRTLAYYDTDTQSAHFRGWHHTYYMSLSCQHSSKHWTRKQLNQTDKLFHFSSFLTI